MILYHATLEQNVDSIVETGLTTGFDGLIYFCTEEKHAVIFSGLRNFTKQTIVTFKVNTEDLVPELIENGMDHNPKFFGPDVIVKTYSENIPRHLIDICNYWTVGR